MSDTASADNPIIFSYEEDQDELELEVSINLQEEIGRGRHGIVYAATYYGCDCVAKEMRHFEEEKEKDKSKDAFLKEMAIIRQLKHPNVIDLLEVCYRKDDRKDAPKLPILIMSKMSITLERFLSKALEKSFLYNKVSIMHNIMCGLHYLHKKGIIHRDLTVKAIFLTEDLCAKIADFGQAKDYTKSTTLTRLPGEFSHMPPEAFTENPKYTFKLDIFSFGCVVIQIIINVKPEPIFETHSTTAAGYTKASEVERRRKYIKRIKDLELNELCDIIEKCLQDKHEDRPEAVKLLPLIQKCKQALPKTTEKSKLDLVHQLSEATQPQTVEVRSESEDRTKSEGNQSWRDHLLECRQQLATDLAHVVDQLVMILGDVISKDECDKIKSFSNPVKKTDALIEAILTRDDPIMYAEFAEGVKVVKPGKWSEELLTYLDQKNLD